MGNESFKLWTSGEQNGTATAHWQKERGLSQRSGHASGLRDSLQEVVEYAQESGNSGVRPERVLTFEGEFP